MQMISSFIVAVHSSQSPLPIWRVFLRFSTAHAIFFFFLNFMSRAIHDVKATDLGLSKVRFKAEVDFDGRVVTRSYLEKQDIDQILNVSPTLLTLYLSHWVHSHYWKAEVRWSSVFYVWVPLQDIQLVKTPEDLENFMLKHGENIIDTLGAEVDRLEKELKVSESLKKEISPYIAVAWLTMIDVISLFALSCKLSCPNPPLWFWLFVRKNSDKRLFKKYIIFNG